MQSLFGMATETNRLHVLFSGSRTSYFPRLLPFLWHYKLPPYES